MFASAKSKNEEKGFEPVTRNNVEGEYMEISIN
jgi:hypothetical protein